MRGARIELVLLALAAACAVYGFGLPRFGFGYEPGPRPTDGLRVVTWNIGVAAEFGEDVSRDEVLRAVGAALRALDADLVFLQEVGDADLEELARAFDASDSEHAGDCGVLARRGRLERLEVTDWQGRPPVDVRYRRRRSGALVHAIGLHASPWSADDRNREVGRAVDLLTDRSLAPVQILAGDLNLDVDLGGGKDLFTDDEYLDVQTYNYAAERLTDAAARAGPTAEPDRRLDYLLVGGEAKVEDAGVWRGRRVGRMDHHPVVVDLELGGR